LLPIKCLNPSELVGNYFFNETVLVMMTHDWLAFIFPFWSFRIGSKRSRQDTNSQIWLVNAHIGLFSFLADKLKFTLFCQ
jgi:hypothetical protein